MMLATIVLFAQLAAPVARQPVLVFPEAGVDDPAAYQGYQTRFYKDASGNTVQIYIEGSAGRVVHLLANADNESIGFTVRGTGETPVSLDWVTPQATVSRIGPLRWLRHELRAAAPSVSIGWFLLGSMRVERDFQYWQKHRQPFNAPRFSLAETDSMIVAMERLPDATRREHLTLLGARDITTLRTRLQPRLSSHTVGASKVFRVTQLALDGRDSLVIEIVADGRTVDAVHAGDSLALRARSGNSVQFAVRIASSADALTPLTRQEIFTPEFLRHLAANRAQRPWLERQTRGVELLSSREKLMAGLPAYATYFGRDMLVSALMMRPIWRDEMSEFVIGSVLRRLGPDGGVSHEEALGGQAVREAADEYARLVRNSLASRDRVRASSMLSRAREVLRTHRRTRENYHMIDDEFQFPILVASWLSDADVTAARKRTFLLGAERGTSRIQLLMRELGLVARLAMPYARDAVVTNLVAFAPRDTGWSASSWRDSGVGYANGKFAMDVNAVYVPHALEAIDAIFRSLDAVGLRVDSLARVMPELAPNTPLGTFARNRMILRRAADTWWGAERHFFVRLSPEQIRARVSDRLAAMTPAEREYWQGVVERTGAANDSLVFLALSLDPSGRPIGVANTDPATRLFLGERPGRGIDERALMRDVEIFTRPFPVGLFIDSVGPVVANDAYATPPVWNAFDRDRYHGPKVVWGREVNLFLLGVADYAGRVQDPRLVRTLRGSFDAVRNAADASGFQSELWSYEVRDGRVVPIRYGTGSDVQLWSTTDLAVDFVRARWR